MEFHGSTISEPNSDCVRCRSGQVIFNPLQVICCVIHHAQSYKLKFFRAQLFYNLKHLVKSTWSRSTFSILSHTILTCTGHEKFFQKDISIVKRKNASKQKIVRTVPVPRKIILVQIDQNHEVGSINKEFEIIILETNESEYMIFINQSLIKV